LVVLHNPFYLLSIVSFSQVRLCMLLFLYLSCCIPRSSKRAFNTAGATIIVAAFATRVTGQEGRSKNLRASNTRQTACPDVARLKAAVGICVAGVILHANGRQWRRRRAKGSGRSGVGNVATK
jgi:hypothetical protein